MATNPIPGVLFCCLAFFLSVRGEIASIANDSVLSREESIGAIFMASDSEFKVLMFVNPAVLPTLRRMVHLYPHLPAHVAWSAIGCTGTERDVNYMRKILEKDSRGEHAPHKAVFADWAIHRLGLLARRDVPGARKLLAEIQQPAFWEGEPIRLYKGDRADVRSQDEIQALILETMGFAKEPGIAARSEMIGSQLKDPVRLDFWQHRAHVDLWIKAGKGLDQIEKKGLDVSKRDDCLLHYNLIPADKRQLLGLSSAPKLSELGRFRGAWNARKTQGAPRLRVLSKEESNSLILEAREEYKRLAALVTQKDVRTFRVSVMSKGEILDRQYRHEEMSREEITRLETDLGQLQKKEREIIQFLSADPPEAVDAVATLETDAGDYSDLFSDIVVVSWKLKGTEKIGRKILEDKLNYYPTLAEDDNLMVVMKKKDGKWYWNPFGW